jgi:hypothetical protein
MIGLLITAAESAPVTEIGKRAFLTLIMFVLIGLSFWGMRIGWKNRSRQDIELPSTDIPAGAIKFTEPLLARFAGTTTSGSWLDRITNFDLGTPRGVDLQVFNTGIYLSDQSQFSLWIAKEQITNIATKQGIAGDVVEKDGMLVITWKLGDLLVDSGLRVNRHADHELIVSALKTFPRSTDLKNDGPQDKAETEA